MWLASDNKPSLTSHIEFAIFAIFSALEYGGIGFLKSEIALSELANPFSNKFNPALDQPVSPVTTTTSPIFAPLRFTGLVVVPTAVIVIMIFSELDKSPPIT